MVCRSRTSRHPGQHRNTKIGDPRDSVTGGRGAERRIFVFWGGGLDVPRDFVPFSGQIQRKREGVF